MVPEPLASTARRSSMTDTRKWFLGAHGMSETANIRKERIERLLKELEYEVTRGMLDGEIEEEMGFIFYVPISKRVHDGVVECRFQTRPMQRWQMEHEHLQPCLRVVK